MKREQEAHVFRRGSITIKVMYKCIDVGSWDFGVKTAEVIPVTRYGLTGNDGGHFFQKRAGDHRFRETLDKMKLAAGEIPIHLVALGTTESFSCNRNGDSFNEKTARERHHTFVKNAHIFYHHENKDPKKSYGKVAASMFNDDMKRVELLVLLNGSKAAAAKNGGIVAPKEDIDLLHSGKELPWSMGCRVAKDECSSCHNKAATPADYCEEHECIDKDGIQRFGCKKGLAKTADDGFVQYVENPNCTFIDISRVSSPADRSAYGYIAKYAADSGIVLGGAALAESRGLSLPDAQHKMAYPHYRQYSDALTKLAAAEAYLPMTPERQLQRIGFMRTDSLTPRLQKIASSLRERDRAAYLMKLADFGVILSPNQFARFNGCRTTGGYKEACSGLFAQMDRLSDNRRALLARCEKYAVANDRSIPVGIDQFPQENYYTAAGTRERMFNAVAAGEIPREKTAGAAIPTQEDYEAAIEYSLYKIAAVVRLSEQNAYETAVLQQR